MRAKVSIGIGPEEMYLQKLRSRTRGFLIGEVKIEVSLGKLLEALHGFRGRSWQPHEGELGIRPLLIHE